MYVVHYESNAHDAPDFLCRQYGERLPMGEALEVIHAALDPTRPPPVANEQQMVWSQSTSEPAGVTCPACKRVVWRLALR